MRHRSNVHLTISFTINKIIFTRLCVDWILSEFKKYLDKKSAFSFSYPTIETFISAFSILFKLKNKPNILAERKLSEFLGLNMKKNLAVPALILSCCFLFALTSSYDETGTIAKRGIVGGLIGSKNKYAFFFRLSITRHRDKFDITNNCGSTLVDNQFLLTSAHCLFHTTRVSHNRFLQVKPNIKRATGSFYNIMENIEMGSYNITTQRYNQIVTGRYDRCVYLVFVFTMLIHWKWNNTAENSYFSRNRQNGREIRIPCSQKCPNPSSKIQVQTS